MWKKICSVSGGLIATGLYFRKIFYLQNYFLETVASDAKVILNKEEIFKETVGSGQAYLLQDVGIENRKSDATSS